MFHTYLSPFSFLQFICEVCEFKRSGIIFYYVTERLKDKKKVNYVILVTKRECEVAFLRVSAPIVRTASRSLGDINWCNHMQNIPCYCYIRVIVTSARAKAAFMYVFTCICHLLRIIVKLLGGTDFDKKRSR